jgi:hypothetical protein
MCTIIFRSLINPPLKSVPNSICSFTPCLLSTFSSPMAKPTNPTSTRPIREGCLISTVRHLSRNILQSRRQTMSSRRRNAKNFGRKEEFSKKFNNSSTRLWPTRVSEKLDGVCKNRSLWDMMERQIKEYFCFADSLGRTWCNLFQSFGCRGCCQPFFGLDVETGIHNPQHIS